MTNLSAHFTLEELTFSQVALRTGLDNVPGPLDKENLIHLCESLLEPARTILGVPIHIDSGFRSHLINSVVGGALNSAHLSGQAADIVPIGMPVLEAFDILRGNNLPFDQIIYECAAWIHISIAPRNTTARRQALTATGRPGAWEYQLV